MTTPLFNVHHKIIFAAMWVAVLPTDGQRVDHNRDGKDGQGLMSDAGRTPFSTFSAACRAAESAGMALAVTKTWIVSPSSSCPSLLFLWAGK
jgi:hypothetical protein